jgi:hypothetical protein
MYRDIFSKIEIHRIYIIYVLTEGCYKMVDV